MFFRASRTGLEVLTKPRSTRTCWSIACVAGSQTGMTLHVVPARTALQWQMPLQLRLQSRLEWFLTFTDMLSCRRRCSGGRGKVAWLRRGPRDPNILKENAVKKDCWSSPWIRKACLSMMWRRDARNMLPWRVVSLVQSEALPMNAKERREDGSTSAACQEKLVPMLHGSASVALLLLADQTTNGCGFGHNRTTWQCIATLQAYACVCTKKICTHTRTHIYIYYIG